MTNYIINDAVPTSTHTTNDATAIGLPQAHPTNLWKYLPQISVSYTSVNDINDNGTTYTIPNIITTPTKIVEAGPESYGVYKKGYTTFKVDPIVFKNCLGNGIYPKARDKIVTSNGYDWTVYKDVDITFYTGLWRLECCRAFLEEPLTDTVDWLPVVNDLSDDYADRTSTNPVVANTFSCRIQPVTTQIGDIFDKRTTHNQYTIFLIPDLDLSFGDVMRDQYGSVYKVITWRSRRDLACLFEVSVELLEVLK